MMHITLNNGWLRAGLVTLAVAVLAGSGAARAQDVFSSNGGGRRTTGTQGVTGNPNCAAPVITQNGTSFSPGNWSCKTGTQALRGALLGNGPMPPPVFDRGALLGRTPGRVAQPGFTPAAPYRAAPGPGPYQMQQSYNPYRNLLPAISPQQAAAVAARQQMIQNRPDMRFFNWAAPQLGVPQLIFGRARSYMRGR